MIQSIPLKKLAASPRNVRKSSDVLADLQLRADIAARGLLQNLVVRKGKRGKFEVEAGGRRLAALQALAEEGTLPENHEVTCLVIEGEESEVREASLAENFQRLAMNPADEAQAFASIIEAGATTEDVARRAASLPANARPASAKPCAFSPQAASRRTRTCSCFWSVAAITQSRGCNLTSRNSSRTFPVSCPRLSSVSWVTRSTT